MIASGKRSRSWIHAGDTLALKLSRFKENRFFAGIVPVYGDGTESSGPEWSICFTADCD